MKRIDKSFVAHNHDIPGSTPGLATNVKKMLMIMNKEKSMEISLKMVFKKELTKLNEIWNFIKENNLEHEQYVLDFLDKLNKISVRN